MGKAVGKITSPKLTERHALGAARTNTAGVIQPGQIRGRVGRGVGLDQAGLIQKANSGAGVFRHTNAVAVQKRKAIQRRGIPCACGRGEEMGGKIGVSHHALSVQIGEAQMVITARVAVLRGGGKQAVGGVDVSVGAASG